MSEDKPSNLWLIAMTMFDVLWAAAASVYLYKSLMFRLEFYRPHGIPFAQAYPRSKLWGWLWCR